MPPLPTLHYGIRTNRSQIFHQLLQVFLVGLTIGMTRIVVPAMAETEFSLGEKQFFLLTSFVVIFGGVKAIMNLFAGRFADQYGRKYVLITGWLFALPIPFLLLYAQNWWWVIVATALLGVNQGLCWSMTLNSKLDITHLNQKGLINGLNEFSGYAAVALAGIMTAWLVPIYGARMGLFLFGTSVILFGLVLAIFAIRETRPWALAQTAGADDVNNNALNQPSASLSRIFLYASWQDKRLLALNQAGLIEKFTDALVWVILPVWFLLQDLTLLQSSSIIGVYAVVWGASQLITGFASDRYGRKPLIVGGMFLCGIGVLLLPFSSTVSAWTMEAALIGFGMAMLYPTLGAAVADISPPAQRSSLLGVYRFWRDAGYAVGALCMGILAQWTQMLEATFWLVGVAMLLSGLWVSVGFSASGIEDL